MPLMCFVCTQHFFTGSVARLYGSSAQGTGPPVLTNVLCSGVEQRLLECPSTSLDVGSCRNREDAGVTCLPGKLLIIIIITRANRIPSRNKQE